MARLRAQNMTPGLPAKPPGMSPAAVREWDRLLADLADSNIVIAKAHGRLIAEAALISVDMAEAVTALKGKDGTYYLNKNTGALMIHPAARRLDSLRRDYVRVLSLIGLRSAAPGQAESGPSLEDTLDE